MNFPTISACLVCEFARQELGNKTILIGFYGVSPHVAVVIQNFKMLVQLCLVFCGGSGEGHFKIELKLRAPNGQEFHAPSIETDLLRQKGVSNFFMGFQETFPGPGVYSATLLANGDSVYEATFSLASASQTKN